MCLLTVQCFRKKRIWLHVVVGPKQEDYMLPKEIKDLERYFHTRGLEHVWPQGPGHLMRMNTTVSCLGIMLRPVWNSSLGHISFTPSFYPLCYTSLDVEFRKPARRTLLASPSSTNVFYSSAGTRRTSVNMDKCSLADDSSGFFFFVCALAYFAKQLRHGTTLQCKIWSWYETMGPNVNTVIVLWLVSWKPCVDVFVV